MGGGVQARVWVLRCEPHNGLEVQSLEERVAQLVGLARAIETVLDHPEVGRWDEDHLERARRQLSIRYAHWPSAHPACWSRLPDWDARRVFGRG
jgi:hypothetical protein